MKYTVKLRKSNELAHIEADSIQYMTGTPSTYLMYDYANHVVAALPADIVASITADEATEHLGATARSTRPRGDVGSVN